jgi:hypothetical protein
MRRNVRSKLQSFFGDACSNRIRGCDRIRGHRSGLNRGRPGRHQVVIYVPLDRKTENWWKIFVREARADTAFHQKSQDAFDLGAPLAAIDDRKRELRTSMSTETFVIENSHTEKKIKQKNRGREPRWHALYNLAQLAHFFADGVICTTWRKNVNLAHGRPVFSRWRI